MMANKVPLTEPSEGDTLSVTNVNADIGNWQVASKFVGKDGDNVRDQGLDVYNFADNSVSQLRQSYSSSSPAIYAGVGWDAGSLGTGIVGLHVPYPNMDLGTHIVRYSFRYHAEVDGDKWVFSLTLPVVREHRWIFAVWYRYQAESPGTYTPWEIIASTQRTLKLVGYQLKTAHLEGSIGNAFSLNAETGITDVPVDIELQVRVHFSTNMVWGTENMPGVPLSAKCLPIRIDDCNFYVEHLKR